MSNSYLLHRVYGGRPAVSTGRVVRALQRLNAEGVAPTLSQLSDRLPDLRKDSISRVLRQLGKRAYTQRVPMPGAERVGQYVLGTYAHAFGLELTSKEQALAAQAESFLAHISRESSAVRADRARRRRARSQFYRDEAMRQAQMAAGLHSQPPG